MFVLIKNGIGQELVIETERILWMKQLDPETMKIETTTIPLTVQAITPAEALAQIEEQMLASKLEEHNWEKAKHTLLGQGTQGRKDQQEENPKD